MPEVKNLVKVYSTKGGVKVRALDDVSATKILIRKNAARRDSPCGRQPFLNLN